MSWQFETDPEFQAELDWVTDFVEADIGVDSTGWAGRRHAETRLRMRSQISRVLPSPGMG